METNEDKQGAGKKEEVGWLESLTQSIHSKEHVKLCVKSSEEKNYKA